MIEVTEKAAEKIKEFIQSQTGPGTIRILLQDEGVNAPFFACFMTSLQRAMHSLQSRRSPLP
jgi:Fe-S cluster assembly iron-binding protein IscA